MRVQSSSSALHFFAEALSLQKTIGPGRSHSPVIWVNSGSEETNVDFLPEGIVNRCTTYSQPSTVRCYSPTNLMVATAKGVLFVILRRILTVLGLDIDSVRSARPTTHFANLPQFGCAARVFVASVVFPSSVSHRGALKIRQSYMIGGRYGNMLHKFVVGTWFASAGKFVQIRARSDLLVSLAQNGVEANGDTDSLHQVTPSNTVPPMTQAELGNNQ